MCECQFDDDPSSSHIDIDNYYQLAQVMGDRRNSREGDNIPPQGEDEEDDVLAQLAQKERDLVLAAELGKALLERNEDLERRNEQIADEFSHKIEELQQEKYELHLKLEKTETEYQNTIKELQYDISQLRHELQTHQQNSNYGDKASADKIRELTQQNERLKEDIRQSSLQEEGLVTEMQSLREQMVCRKSSMHFHISQLEILQEEVNLLNKRKNELEKRITMVTDERDSLASSHEEGQERILMLERTKRETEAKLQSRERDMIELQETNLQLQAQIHHLASRSSNHSSPINSNNQSQTLFNELSQLSPSSHQSQPLLHELCPMSPTSPSPEYTTQYSSDCQMSLAEMMEEDDFECDDDDDVLITSDVHRSHDFLAEFTQPNALTDSQFLTNFQEVSQDYCSDYELKEELVNVYQQLKQLCRDCGRPVDDENYKVGGLSPLLQDLRGIMQDMVSFKSQQVSSSEVQTNLSDDEDTMLTIHKQIGDLRLELVAAQSDLDKVKDELSDRDVKLKEKTKELSHLTNKVKLTLQHEELSRLQNERDRLQDTTRKLSPDDLVQEARRERDEAIDKQNKMEVELTKSKMEVMSMNQQLMEAIQQKVALSQELAQWQVDMEDLLEFQLRERIKEESVKEQVIEHLRKQISLKKSKSTSFLVKES